MAEHAVEVIEVIESSPLDRTYVLGLQADADPFLWSPGQYTWITDPAQAEPKARAYSISSAPGASGRFELTIRARSAEDVDRFGYVVGQALVATSPEGSFTPPFTPGEHLLLCGAGSGVAPFRACVQHALGLDAPPQVVLVQSDRTPSTLLFRSEFERYAAAHEWLTYAPRVTGEDHAETWDGATGRVTADEIDRWIDDPASTRVYACGPGAFVDGLLEAAKALGVPDTHRHREGWG